MALIKFGGGVVQMSGSIAGTVFARNRFGNYARPRTKPINPASERQVVARARLAFVSEAWRSSPMTDAIRLAWKVYADSVNWLNRLGEQVTLTGANMFVQCNTALLAAGSSLITAAPIVLGLPAQDPIASASISEATQIITITFDDTFDWLDEDEGHLSVYMGSPVSPSHNFFGGPYRFAGAIDGNSTTPPTTPDATITAPFTAIETQKAWVQLRLLREDGRCSTLFGAAPVTIAA